MPVSASTLLFLLTANILLIYDAALDSGQLLSDFQSAYRPHYSTETALLKVTNDLLCAKDDCKISVRVLLDLSAAIDTTDHGILLHRLHNVFGFGDTMLSWFQSYLENRTQTVVVHGNTRLQLLFVMVYYRDLFLDQYFYSLHTASIKCHSTLSRFSSNMRR